jgi:hypothetical protein
MDVIVNVVFWFIVLVIFSSLSKRNARRQRVNDAYKWKKPQIHGGRKFEASRTDLRKAGLL